MAYDTGNIPPMSMGNLPSGIFPSMRDNYRMEEKDREVAYVKKRMKEMGLNQRSLAIAAGLKPDIVRNRLSGKAKHWRQDNYSAIMRVLGDKPPIYIVDKILMEKCSDAIMQVAKEENISLTLSDAIKHTVELYNRIMKYRTRGEEIMPNTAIASLVFDIKAS